MFRVNKRFKQKFRGYLCKVKLKCNGSLIPFKIDTFAQSQNEKKNSCGYNYTLLIIYSKIGI